MMGRCNKCGKLVPQREAFKLKLTASMLQTETTIESNEWCKGCGEEIFNKNTFKIAWKPKEVK